MYKHKDVLEYPVDSVEYARHSAEVFLNCYQKQDINIVNVVITEKKHTKVEVEFSDDYEEICYPTKDFVPNDGNEYHI